MSLNSAQNILNHLSSVPFVECYPLSREFRQMPKTPGLYAVRHEEEGILYLGLAVQLRRRFKDGHKAFFWAFLDYYSPDQIRIAIYQFVEFQSFQQAEDLEVRMIRMMKPRYNSRIK